MNDRIASRVGPVLLANGLGRAIGALLLETHPGGELIDRGAYLRFRVAERCTLERRELEARLGEPIRFPSDLERVMSSFCGRLELDAEHAVWSDGPGGRA